MKKSTINKKMLLLMGPQGSGNHLFSKIFALHPDVNGWSQTLDKSEETNYFLPHYKEPFSHYWHNLELIDENIMGGKNYACVSVSIPFWIKDKFVLPPAQEFIERVRTLDIDVQVVMIGRDRNILTHQETRLRGGPTWGCALQFLKSFKELPFFVSTELLYLYRRRYVKTIGQWLDFPVADEDPRIEEILSEDTNAKYINFAKNEYLDNLMTKQQPYKDE
jgi:hypothetical protein